MKFGFIGGTPRGFSLFNDLLSNNYKPEFCVILKEDDHENIKVSAEFLEVANRNNIPSSVKKKLVETDYSLIKSLSLDFIIVCGWRTIIKPEINDFLKDGMIAAHDSLLPKYRGFAPLNWAIINGEQETGITLFFINDGETDSGDIIGQEKITIENEDSINDVYTKVIEATKMCFLKMLKDYEAHKDIRGIKQDEELATYTCKRTPDDGRIDWNDSSAKVYNLIRALIYPYSGAYFYHKDQKYVIRSARIGLDNNKEYAGRIPGRVIHFSEMGIEVLCGSGSILIKEVFDERSGAVVNANEIFKSITLKLL